MKTIPVSEELRSAYKDFADLTFELLWKACSDHKYLRLAAVNAQISLELFLKYLYVEEGRIDEIRKTKNGLPVNDFVDFSQILNYSYSEGLLPYVKKADLRKLIDVRNSIVHRGIEIPEGENFSETVVACFLLIHVLSSERFGDYILSQDMGPHPICENVSWVSGVEKFVSSLTKGDESPVNCIHCNNRTLVGEGLVALDSPGDADEVVCLCCLMSFNTSIDVEIFKCPVCDVKSYFVDALNPQDNQFYVGGCSTCDYREWVRECAGCFVMYFPSQVKEHIYKGEFFCSKDCT